MLSLKGSEDTESGFLCLCYTCCFPLIELIVVHHPLWTVVWSNQTLPNCVSKHNHMHRRGYKTTITCPTPLIHSNWVWSSTLNVKQRFIVVLIAVVCWSSGLMSLEGYWSCSSGVTAEMNERSDDVLQWCMCCRDLSVILSK